MDLRARKNQRHTWYLTPVSGTVRNDPWLRAELRRRQRQATSGTVTSSSLPTIQSPVVYLDDYDGTGAGSNDGAGIFTAGTGNTLTYRRLPADTKAITTMPKR